MSKIENLFIQSVNLKKKIIREKNYKVISKIGNVIADSIIKGGKILICGNGGSAADAQHLAAEMLIRLRPKYNRESIPAIALALDTSTITACGNDYSFENLYSRMIESLGNKKDVLLVISTSGKSQNILQALKTAKKKKIKCVGFLGAGGGVCIKYCNLNFLVPSDITGRIQEMHITAGHALMEHIEDRLLKKKFITLKRK